MNDWTIPSWCHTTVIWYLPDWLGCEQHFCWNNVDMYQLTWLRNFASLEYSLFHRLLRLFIWTILTWHHCGRGRNPNLGKFSIYTWWSSESGQLPSAHYPSVKEYPQRFLGNMTTHSDREDGRRGDTSLKWADQHYSHNNHYVLCCSTSHTTWDCHCTSVRCWLCLRKYSQTEEFQCVIRTVCNITSGP